MHALHPYPSPEARDARLRALVEGARGEVVRFGDTVEGRPLLAGRLPRLGGGSGSTGATVARALFTANIHGPEYVSSQVALGLLEAVENLESLRRLRARAELWVVPCLNPDGYARTWERGGAGSLAELRTNARGVDLNRNFPLPAGKHRWRLPGAGSTRKGAATYVGEAPLSEPESAALARLLAERAFLAAANGHSFMGRLIPAHVEGRAEFHAYADLCRAFAAAQPGARYRRLASRHFDTFTGELEDFQHHHHGMWAVCLETFPWWASLRQHLRAPSLFWRFNPRDPQPWVDNDVPGVAAWLEAALETPRPSGEAPGGAES